MAKKLFLLDGMALVYRAHFALIARPIFTSKGFNTSAIFVFTQTLLDILNNQQPTHIAVVFDTEAPTQRHKDFADYKSQRETMPEELSQALPHIRRLIESFNIPVITCDGYEADDLIGTLVRRAEKESFISYMVTPDKDFGQLVSEKTLLYRPSRMGDAVEILGVPEILNKWGITRPEQVIDILGLWGDTSDNIPGVPGIGEKTASKLIAQYGTIENILEHTAELKGKLKETLETHREQALLSKRLATIICDAPCEIELEKLRRTEPNEEQLKAFCTEFELNSIGRRLPLPKAPPVRKLNFRWRNGRQPRRTLNHSGGRPRFPRRRCHPRNWLTARMITKWLIPSSCGIGSWKRFHLKPRSVSKFKPGAKIRSKRA
jgi:DNA polymerase I